GRGRAYRPGLLTAGNNPQKNTINLKKYRINIFTSIWQLPYTYLAFGGAGNTPLINLTRRIMKNERKPWEPLKFALGRVVATPNALRAIPAVECFEALARHAVGDWGECGPEDWQENELSLKEGFRLFSVYRSSQGVKFWIITEADRSATTILLPEDY